MCRVSGLWSGLPGCRLSSQCGQWCALTALPPRHLTTELVSGWCTDLVWTADGSAVTPACRLPYLLVLVNRLRLDVGDVSGCELIRLSGFVPLRSCPAALVINNQSLSNIIKFTAGWTQPGNTLVSSPGRSLKVITKTLSFCHNPCLFVTLNMYIECPLPGSSAG